MRVRTVKDWYQGLGLSLQDCKLFTPAVIGQQSSPDDVAKFQADPIASCAVGEPVKVQPVLVLPGGFVDRKGRSAVLVVNPRETVSLFPRFGDTPLGDKMVVEVAHRLEERCRDVEPRGHEEVKEGSDRNRAGRAAA